MKKLPIDFDEIQKAMEDIERNAFEYFLDRETGEILILSEDIMHRANEIISAHYDDDNAEYDAVELDEEPDIPDWMEDEIELALEILLFSRGQYVRIPERSPGNVFAAMKSFVDQVENPELADELRLALDGKGAFRRFKDALDPFPKERKLWYGFSAKAAKKDIEAWLGEAGIVASARRHPECGT